MEIFKLFGSILIDSSEAEKSISKTGEEAEGLGSKLKSGLKTAAKWGAAVAGAATAVGGAMIKAAKDSADALGDIDDAAQRVGVDAETMQELEYVAKMSGLAMTDLEKAAKKLEGTDLNLDEAIDQIMALGTAEEQTQMAIDLFGESVAYNLQPLLNHGAEGIEEFKNQARDLGIIMSNEAVESGAQFGDMFDAVSSSISSLKNGLMADLMPYVMEILNWLIENLPMIKETVKSVMDAILPLVKEVLDILMQVIPPVFSLIKELLDWLMPYIKPILESIGGLVEGLFALLSGDTETFVESIKDFFINLATALFGIGKDIITSLWNGCKEVWKKVEAWFTEKIEFIKKGFKAAANIDMEQYNPADGVHASGLNYVPYDGYTAQLHRGEAILSAGNTQNLASDIASAVSSAIGGATSSQPINVTLELDGNTLARVMYKYNAKEESRRGVSAITV